MPVLTLPHSEGASLSVRAKALLFEDPRSLELLQRIELVAPSEATVLVTGETGTGKEIVARHIHELSRRRDRSFVGVNCGAFSENLVESELFGHERGAFTGAATSKSGWFEAAHGGTLFLDEIGDLPLPVQVKLLRVLQEHEVVRLGSRQPLPIDVRLVAATNVDLHAAMDAGHFREDLFYRLNVTTLRLPALRERPGDILPLSRFFLERHSRRMQTEPAKLGASAEQRLLEHAWPGNIRELENAIHHALLVCHGGRIEADDLRLVERSPKSTRTPGRSSPSLESAFLELFERQPEGCFEHVERELFRAAYRHCEQNQLQTARLLGISRNVVRARLIQHGELQGSLRSSSPPAAGRKLRIGYQKFGWLVLTRLHGGLEGALARRGVTLEWQEFHDGAELVRALGRGDVELGAVGECPPVFAQASELPLVYLAADEPTPEGEAIVVAQSSTIASVAELRGKKVALSREANVHYLLIRALEEAGLSYGDVQVVDRSPDDAVEELEQGAIDAWAIWDPHLSAARATGAVRVLRDGLGLTQNVAFYVGTRAFAECEPDLVAEVLRHIEAAATWARENSDAVTTLLSPKLLVPKELLAVSLRRNRGPRPLDGNLFAAQQRIADALHRERLIPRPVTVRSAEWQPRMAS
jgi:aliphatic sulfonates family ABC transporter substrate-binding protein